MTGLDKIIGKITQDAKAEADKHYENADMNIAHMKSEAIDYMMRMERVYDARAEKMAGDIISRAESSSETAYRNTLLEKKSEMISLAFDRAADKIRSYPKKEYIAFMTSALIYAVKERKRAKEEISELFGEEEAELDSGYEIIFNKKDNKSGAAKEIFDSAEKELKDIKGFKLSDDTAYTDGGFILKCGDVETNCSVEVMIAEARSRCESKVIEKLF